jgi:16S rRNA G966 N2-methylase RsmD
MRQWLARQSHRVRLVCNALARGHGAHLWYELRNRQRGLDLKFVPVEQLGVPPSRAHWYSDSGGPDFLRILDSIAIPHGSVAVDLGSGKGGAAISMARRHFARVTGVEISPTLAQVAAENARRARLDNLDFITSDASEFTALDPYTHIYLYNPFPCAVMADVLQNLRASLSRRARPLTLIYRNPVCDAAIAASGLFRREREFKRGEHWWYIYRHEPRVSATLPAAP